MRQELPKRLSVILPCYNPPTGWETALAERWGQLSPLFVAQGVIPRLTVVNDGSPRGITETNLDHLRTLMPDVQIVDYRENRGKGYALRAGVRASDADFYLVTDADFPYTPPSMQQIVACLLSEGGIAAGNRDLNYYAHVPAFRRWLSKALRWMLRHLLRLQVTDSQCGLKGFDQAGKAVFLDTVIDRFLFDLEFLMLAKGRVKVTPVPVELRPGVVFSKVGWKILATEGRNFMGLLVRQWLGQRYV
jgi:glycosyltransferase involved in cell wall biosynthesis